MFYKNHERNHVVLPGREKALADFINQDYGTLKGHKLKNACNSNSEDALTWSCFDILSNMPHAKKILALNELAEDAYEGNSNLVFPENEQDISIHIGKQYQGKTTDEKTEVDASIEFPGTLVFFEAKLYSTVSLAAPPEKPFDQIARKLRIGLDSPLGDERQFFFIFLDIAPYEKLYRNEKKSVVLAKNQSGYDDKYKSAWLFKYYKFGRNNSLKPLKEILAGISTPSIEDVANNMGWLTWGDLFKVVLRQLV